MWTLTFWRATAERAIKTTAQTAGATLIAAGSGLLGTDWLTLASVSGMAGLLSLLTSVGSAGIGPAGPSLTSERLDDGGA